MTPKRTSEVLSAYYSSMTELKFRLRAVECAIIGRLNMPSTFVREFSYLQLRMCCELLALSCVIVHDSLTERGARRLLKEYHAGKIMALLAGLHPDFFPRHANISFNVTPDHHELIDVEQEGMTRELLDDLYVRCGAALHRGSTVSFMKGYQIQIEKEYADIRLELIKFRRLLTGCAMRTVCGNHTIICAINWENDEPAIVKYARNQTILN